MRTFATAQRSAAAATSKLELVLMCVVLGLSSLAALLIASLARAILNRCPWLSLHDPDAQWKLVLEPEKHW